MSPRKNTRLGTSSSSSDTSPLSRDTTPETPPGLPFRNTAPLPGDATSSANPTMPAERPPVIVQVREIASQASPGGPAAQRSLDNYHLLPELLFKLSEPDATSGIRTFKGRRYVDLQEGGTVLLGQDAELHFRARSSTELNASGPRLEQVEGSLLWRRVPDDAMAPGDASQPSTSRRRPLDDEPSQAVAPKRANTAIEPFKPHWELLPGPLAGSAFITVEGIPYKVLTRSDARDYPITYIQAPDHPRYEFETLEIVLKSTPDEQPRAAMRVPPDNRWEIDPRLPFDKPLTDYVKEAFPELFARTAENVARKQFELANGASVADAAGLTALRQIYHGWQTGAPSVHPQWSDPLLMLTVTPTLPPTTGNARSIHLPSTVSMRSLDRLDFDPQRFQQQWDYVASTYSPTDIKRFMADVLTRNGYTVFEPSTLTSFAALVFSRRGHDYLFFMSLHRTRGQKIHLPPHTDPNTTSVSLDLQVGETAASAVRRAHDRGEIIWLKGGCQIQAGYPDTVFIIRDDNARL
ncbi:hypothetical protein [Pseudomonas citrulli]|uniref:Uncharacterized protein n=1 Tax=Pseudomonas citrulli TaxID=3064347 RepID=A0ABT9BZH4_9PSED|nr:hypothetical protein [Pseudomonas sp. K18]MDO7897611.1 hypothetical protein [Pseudomonas sp. K18]